LSGKRAILLVRCVIYSVELEFSLSYQRLRCDTTAALGSTGYLGYWRMWEHLVSFYVDVDRRWNRTWQGALFFVIVLAQRKLFC